MVAPTRTYHIVGKIPEDRLKLGTIIDDLHNPDPLNTGEEPDIEHGRLYCEHDLSFEASPERILKRNFAIGLKFWGVTGTGGHVSMGRVSGGEETYTSEALDTIYFNPKREDYDNAVKSTSVQEFLKFSGYKPVYIITGLKIVHRPNIILQRSGVSEYEAKAGLHTGHGVHVGPKLGASKSLAVTQKSQSTDKYIFAIRVTKLTYKRKYLVIPGSREWRSEQYRDGAELAGANRLEEDESDDLHFDVEESELDAELDACLVKSETQKDGNSVTWVVSPSIQTQFPS
ncbi:hypothetical protein B0O99DRAFT_591085 [Bisporella sp. PMI_857]|nr:hypothetical protein B0O99DRAFT_591085 [Bisporella sp. PMI_857]